MTQFNAAVWRGDVRFEIEPVTLKPIQPHDVVVRVTAANVNISDYILLLPENRYPGESIPQIHGHGGVGIVEQVGESVTRVAKGDRVVMLGTPQCGKCWYCLKGRAYQCAELLIVGNPHAIDKDGTDIYPTAAVGAFAEMTVMPEIQLVPVKTEVSDSDLGLLSVAYGSGLGAALITAPITAGATVAAVGLGVSGLAYIQAAKLAGASMIIGVDPIKERRDIALANGATHVVDPSDGDPVQAVYDITGDMGGLQGGGADFVFESAGTTEGMQQAWAMTRQTCDLVLSTVPYKLMDTVSFPAVGIACMGKRVHSNQYGSFNILRDIPWAVQLIESGQLDLSSLAGKSYALNDINQALTDVAEHKVLEATLTF